MREPPDVEPGSPQSPGSVAYDRPLLLGPKRNDVLELWEVERYGLDNFGDPDWLCLYGLRPREWYERGARMLGRTAVECTRDRLAAAIGSDVAAVVGEVAPERTVVVDPFAGSGNTLWWLAQALEPRAAVGFELDDAVAAITQQNADLLGVPMVVHHAPYERGIADVPDQPDDLVVVFVAPPWGDALADGELDLRRTTPSVAEIVDRVVARFGSRRLLLAVQLYEQVEPDSLTDIVDRCAWSHRTTYDVAPPGKNPGLLLGTMGWSP